jgi:hypothetical protein
LAVVDFFGAGLGFSSSDSKSECSDSETERFWRLGAGFDSVVKALFAGFALVIFFGGAGSGEGDF